MLKAVKKPINAHEEDLVAYYPLNEGAGDRVCDLSGNGNDGRIMGAQWTKLGKRYALQFDGIDDHIFCGGPAALDIRGPLTLSVWVMQTETPAGEVGIAGKHFSSYLITYFSDRKAYAYIAEGNNNVNAPIRTGVWNHHVSVFDGEKLRLFLNGQLAAERVSKHKSTPSGKNFVIGCVVGDMDASDPNYRQSVFFPDSQRESGFFKGMIAEVKVYSRALSEEEISAQYTKLGTERFGLGCSRASRIRHKVLAPQTFSSLRLGNGADDPLVFATLPYADLGVLVEDDIGRAQFEPVGVLNEAGFNLAHFGMDARKAYTFRWGIYPLPPTGDAFAFINKVREDWGVNHTILGPCSFFGIDWKLLDDPEGLKKYLQRILPTID